MVLTYCIHYSILSGRLLLDGEETLVQLADEEVHLRLVHADGSGEGEVGQEGVGLQVAPVVGVVLPAHFSGLRLVDYPCPHDSLAKQHLTQSTCLFFGVSQSVESHSHGHSVLDKEHFLLVGVCQMTQLLDGVVEQQLPLSQESGEALSAHLEQGDE